MKRKATRFLALAMSAVLVISLTACGDGSDENAKDAVTPVEAQPMLSELELEILNLETKYNKGKPDFWKKEHQVKVWAVEFQPIGFAVIHKQEALDYFADKQRFHIEVERQKKVSDVTHRYYWELVSRIREKPAHPGESDEFIPAAIRGKHYDSWSQIAEDLGYREDS